MAISDKTNDPNVNLNSSSKDSWGEWRLFVLNKLNENNDNTRTLADNFVKKYDRFEEKLSETQEIGRAHV